MILQTIILSNLFLSILNGCSENVCGNTGEQSKRGGETNIITIEELANQKIVKLNSKSNIYNRKKLEINNYEGITIINKGIIYKYVLMKLRNLVLIIYSLFCLIFINDKNKYRIILKNIFLFILGNFIENKISKKRTYKNYKILSKKLFIKNKYTEIISIASALVHLYRLLLYLLKINFNKGYTSNYSKDKKHHGKHFIPVCIFLILFVSQKSKYFNLQHKLLGKTLSYLYLIILFTGSLRSNSIKNKNFKKNLINFGFIGIFSFFGAIDAARKKDFITHIFNLDFFNNFLMTFSEVFPLFVFLSNNLKFPKSITYNNSIKPFFILTLYSFSKIIITLLKIKKFEKEVIFQYLFANLFPTFLFFLETIDI